MKEHDYTQLNNEIQVVKDNVIALVQKAIP